MKVVGTIQFDSHVLDVYDSLDTPFFNAVDVAKLIDYSAGNTSRMLLLIEKDEYLQVNIIRAGQKRQVNMITELGLYSILSQSTKPIARKWRRVVHSNLILLRKQNQLTIAGQFEEWDMMREDFFIDTETGELMEIRTVMGGDVEIIPYKED
jgi:prophage antirepressor-like protein